MKYRLAVSALALMLFASSPSFADVDALTLHDAMAETYLHNPNLEAARAKLRSVDEGYVQAEAGFKPTVDGTATYTSTHRELDGSTTSNSDPKELALSLSQSIYAGGSTVAAVNQSENEIFAERAQLKVTEQAVLLSGVEAYMNLIRDYQTVQLRINNEKVLESHMQAARQRFELGDITKTDVSQAESRYAGAVAARIKAEGELKTSNAAFEKIIGQPPRHLQKPAVTFKFPATEDKALAIAMDKNPRIALAKYQEAAAKFSTRGIEGERLPQVDLSASAARTYDPASVTSDDQTSRAVMLRATLPLYAGGATVSRIREARQLENRYRMLLQSEERDVRQMVIDARENLAAAEAQSKALQTQIDASHVALEGVKVEADYGSRTTLDLLDAEQEYLDAQVAHISAETDRIVASYSLLAALGSLTAEGLQLNVPAYDPVKNFQNVSGKRINWPFHGDK